MELIIGHGKRQEVDNAARAFGFGKVPGADPSKGE